MSTDTPHATPGSKDALEREIEETRDALVDTVDAIAERVTPGKVVDRTTEQLKRDAQRAAEDVQQKARGVQHQVQAYVEEDPDRARKLGLSIVGVLLLAWFVGRRQARG